jgi:hypothetical protein
MTNKDWAKGIDGCLWSAEMILHASDGSEATLLVGHAPMANPATDQSKIWLLTIHEQLVMRHMVLMHSVIDGEWRRLMGMRVQIHLSVRMTESELTDGHKTGDLVTVLVFSSRMPFIFKGTARFLILPKGGRGCDPLGEGREGDHDDRGFRAGQEQEHGRNYCGSACQEVW